MSIKIYESYKAMIKSSFIAILGLTAVLLPGKAFAKPFNHISINSKIDTRTLQSKCSNTCLSNYSDILRCSSAKIILDDLLQNELNEEDFKKLRN